MGERDKYHEFLTFLFGPLGIKFRQMGSSLLTIGPRTIRALRS